MIKAIEGSKGNIIQLKQALKKKKAEEQNQAGISWLGRIRLGSW